MSLNKRKIFLFTFITAALAVIIDALVLEHLFFSVKKFKIGEPDKRRSFVRILHMTDLHFRTEVSWKYKKLVKKIQKLHPDIIFISGDSIDQKGQIPPLEKFLRLLDSKIPKVAILGNHEYEAGIDVQELKESYRKTNTDLLINESKAYSIMGKRIMVTGVDDMVSGNDDFTKAVKDVGYEDHHFVLIHSPKHQEKIIEHIKQINSNRPENEQLNIYSFFAGHNHGGQVRLGKLIPHLPPQSGGYIEGWYNKKKPYLYLSKGFGTSTIPVRFWARSEITVFEYH